VRGDPEIVALLLEKGADPNLSDDFSVTPLMQAAARGDLVCLTALLDAGADVEATNAWNIGALAWSEWSHRSDDVRMMLQR